MKGGIVLGLVFLLEISLAGAVQEVSFYGVFDQVEEYWSNGDMTILITRHDSQSDNPGSKISNFVSWDYAGDVSDPTSWIANFSFDYEGVTYKESSLYPQGTRFFYSSDGKVIQGEIVLAFVDGTGTNFNLYQDGQLIQTEDIKIVYSFRGALINDTQRISSVESWKNSIDSWKIGIDSWKQQIDNWKTSVQNTLTNLTNNISNLFGVTNNHENRITFLEEQDPIFNLSIEDYWSYLEFKDRERIACGFGMDTQLELFKMLDLGVSCEIEYGGSKPKCECSEVQGICQLDDPLYCFSWELKRDALTLEVRNQAGENIDVMSIDVEGCSGFSKKTKINNGASKKIKINCFEEFTDGNVVIEYQKTDGVLKTVNGEIDLIN